MSVNLKRRQILQMSGVLALSPIFPVSSRAQLPVLSGPTMGTQFKVHIHKAPERLNLPGLKRSVERVLETTESLMSTYRPTSEISRFNTSSSLEWQHFSADTMRVAIAALQVKDQSGGAFNPGAGPLVDYWGFGPDPGATPDTELPPPGELLDRVNGANIELDYDRIRKSHSLAALDFNGIAKGDAIDGIARMLEQFGIFDYLVEIGGEIRALGPGPSGSGWIVGLENPEGEILARIYLTGKAVATSGDYMNFFTQNGKRYSHLIDPRSGFPISHDLTLVNVIADSAMEADAWATALMVLGSEDGYRYARENAMAALFLIRQADSYKLVTTAEFETSGFEITGIA